jgi:elongation factor G
MHADEREDVGEAVAGDIVAATGLRRTATGDTLCDRNRAILLEAIVFPEPMVSQVLEPKSRADQDRLASGMARLEDEDPTFRSRLDAETGQMVVSGMGELHLDVIVERLYREFGVRVTVGSPNVAYRETIAASAEEEVRLDRSSRGGEYAHVLVRLEPGAPGSGFSFESRLPEGLLPEPYVRSVRAGAEQAAASGVLAGYPVVDFRVILCGGSHREGESSEDGFAAAGALAVRDAMARAQPLLLEPAMLVEAIVPEDSFGEVVAQLTGKQAVIEGVEARDGRMHVRAFAALRTMLGYARELRSASRGRGTYTMQLGGYRPVPSDVRERVVRRARGELA